MQRKESLHAHSRADRHFKVLKSASQDVRVPITHT